MTLNLNEVQQAWDAYSHRDSHTREDAINAAIGLAEWKTLPPATIAECTGLTLAEVRECAGPFRRRLGRLSVEALGLLVAGDVAGALELGVATKVVARVMHVGARRILKETAALGYRDHGVCPRCGQGAGVRLHPLCRDCRFVLPEDEWGVWA